MKKVLGFGILAALAVFGCQVEEEGELAPEGKVFMATTEAYIADGIETKTSMDADGNVLWKRGDQVSIFVGRNINDQYQVADAYDGRTEAAMNLISSPGFVAGSEIANNVAVYPYSSTTFLNKEGENSYSLSGLSLTEKQNYANASFGNGAFPMVAVTSSTRDYNLKFKNVLGGLKLQLKGTAIIKSVSITGNNNERLCGDAEITVSTATTPSISLNDESATTLTLDCGDGVQLNETTATAFIIALPPMTMTGGFTVVVIDTDGATMEIKTTKTQTITRSNLLSMPAVTYEGTAHATGHQYVDLGLTSGLKWASCNIGASSPEDYGDYFAWGATEPYYENQDPLAWKANKTGYNWTTCPFRTSGNSWDNVQFSKYNTSSSHGPVDNKTVLESEDDAAHVNWGGTWRMPTDEEWTELRTECTWIWTTLNGVNGRLVTGPNGNSIFLPAAGRRDYTNLLNIGSYGDYWSSSLSTAFPSNAWYVGFYSNDVYRSSYNRFDGFSVRPVSDEDVRVSVTEIFLDKSTLELAYKEKATITATVAPSNATHKNVIWSSSNTSVATVSWTGVVTAVAAGTATITATTYDGGLTATCSVIITNPYNGHDWVDLGLPSGLKWATCNVGANAPKEYGDYFAWGETAPYYTEGHSQDNPCSNWKANKSGYNWGSYKWCNGSFSTLTKYCTNSSYGTIDNKTVLEAEDDAAHVNWGGTWRMPTDEEWTELRTKCTWTWTTQNGVDGRLVTGPNGNSIFLPAAGERSSTNLYNIGSGGYYWSSLLYTSSPNSPYNADGMNFSSAVVSDGCYRIDGRLVRPVSDEGVRVSVTNISLNQNSLTLTEGGTVSLTATVTPSNATQPAVIWSSSNTSVATVDYSGVVTAVSVGFATITATTYDGGHTISCEITVSPYQQRHDGEVNGHYYVDLGLPSGLKWATCNVGADNHDDYGDYFAWGETEPYYMEGHSQDSPCSNWKANKSGYNWESYQWGNGTTLTKYNSMSSYGSVDNNYVLDIDDDAASANWGGTWRMPTYEEWLELITNCTWTWITQNGVNGRLVTGSNGNSIFLPAAGCRANTSLNYVGSRFSYWSSSLYCYPPEFAYGIMSLAGDDYFSREIGLAVRPVTE